MSDVEVSFLLYATPSGAGAKAPAPEGYPMFCPSDTRALACPGDTALRCHLHLSSVALSYETPKCILGQAPSTT